MSWSVLSAVVGAIVAVASLNLGSLRWMLDRRDRKQESFSVHFDSLSNRVLIVERLQANAPGWETMQKIRRDISEMDGHIKTLVANGESIQRELGHQREGITRIEGHLRGNNE